MAEPAVTATALPVSDAVRRHPLATQTGLSLLVSMIEADKVWSGCTPVQRRLLDGLCRSVIDRLLEAGELLAAELPALPGSVQQPTRRSLANRGLLDMESSRITGRAVFAWYWTVRFKEENRATEVNRAAGDPPEGAG